MSEPAIDMSTDRYRTLSAANADLNTQIRELAALRESEAKERKAEATERKADERARRRLTKQLAGGLLGLLGLGGGGAGVYTATRPDEVKAADVQATVEAQAASASAEVQATVDKRTDEIDLKVRRLGRRVVRQQAAIVDGVDYLADMIDAAHPDRRRALDGVEAPPGLEDARAEVDADRERGEVADLLNGSD